MTPQIKLDSDALPSVSAAGKPFWPGIAEHPEVRAVCLFGSAAREEEGADSDLDVLVVVADSPDRLALRRQARSIRDSVGDSAQVCLLTEGRLRENFANRTVFAAHLAREGRVVADRDGVLTGLLEEHPKDTPVRETATRLSSQLQVYSDLSWCGGHYLFCLADLYAWSRSGAMLALARKGEFEFDRERVFDRLAAAYPDLRSATAAAKRLRPFWERVNRHGTRPLPFPAVGSDRPAVEAREACRAILEKSL
jgi:predicted nucleotidyltransferase